ncbi:hypothetical protein [Actinoplanes awajinensis]|uniref:ESX-1 secretion-associated protein n=1 Tax=Actinoplanes awajinensis subsp. mycoplanecinus TaxID=135947 RepID=A0A101JB77_9ACTN|nr:hypothetical protein [Actinoplanes awajinensis]KUL23578.1 hypothetical protein ADL15_46295 [Actinoplanes awajinensis subsp. mycoplanecinus]
MTGFSVSHEQLAEHAAQVQSVAAAVAECRAAGDAVGFGGTEAYGLFLQGLLPPVLEFALGDTCGLLGKADELAQAISTGVQANNESYLRNEAELADLLRSIAKEGW